MHHLMCMGSSTTLALIEAVSQASAASGLGLMVDFCVYARSVLYNGLGRYERAFELRPIGYGPLVMSELAEAAAKTGDAGLAQSALESASGRARVTPTPSASSWWRAPDSTRPG
jgi:hypothetical protein